MKQSQKFLQKRKFLMVLPLLVLPFLTMIFWALGGGSGTPVQAMSFEKTGLNLELPSAHFNNEEWNKLALYDRAQRDSLKSEEERQNDPYFNLTTLQETQAEEGQQEPAPKKENKATPRNTANTFLGKQDQIIDPNEAKVNQKLDQLYKELNREPDATSNITNAEATTSNTSDPQFSSDVKQLEKMMESMNKGNEADPEMLQISGMLEKILDIQHPDRVSQKIREQSEQNKGHVFPVTTSRTEDNVSLINSNRENNKIAVDSSALLSRVLTVKAQQNSFYGLDDQILEEEPRTGNAIEAVIHDTQELVAGSTVKMRLMNDVYINGRLISKDQLVYGTATINGERLTIAINSIRDENSLFPVSLTIYDLDGIEGIYIPGAITRDVAKQSSDQAMQSMQFLTMDQSLKAQAASAGLQAAKGLFSKNIKLIKVTVKAGYKILLMDKK